MKSDRTRWWILTFTAVVLVGVAALPVGVSTEDFPRPERDRIRTAMSTQSEGMRRAEMSGRLPLHFEENQGQTHSSVKFLSRGPGYGLFLTATEAVLVLSKSEHSKANVENRESAVVRMQLSGANPQPEVTAVGELETKTNYFLGNDPASWRTNVPNYAKVRYRDVYPGIDSIYYGNGRKLEYDFVVGPGADPGAIRLVFDGSQRVSIDSQGDLDLQVGDEHIRVLKPIAYQQMMGNRLEIPVEYVLVGGHHVGFNIGSYDEREPLVIDPVISYATYFGGNALDVVDGIAVDGDGNIYIAGGTASTNFPTATPLQASNEGFQDVFVSKLNPAGTAILYSTYLGGDSDDYGQGMAIDSEGNAYIAGFTLSNNFPMMSAVQSSIIGGHDAFLTKLNESGSALVYSTYLGGNALEAANSIAVDTSGNAHVAGYTTSTNFPTTVNAHQPSLGGGSQDAFVAKLNAEGTAYVYATYLGGGGPGAIEQAFTVALDGSQKAYVVGSTDSQNFPTVSPRQSMSGGGTQDAFVTRWSTTGTLEYSTYHGGLGEDAGTGIAADATGIYVTGSTGSTNFPLFNAFQTNLDPGGLSPRDAFISKFNPAGSGFVYSTYLGGNRFDSGFAILPDGSGNAYIVGATTSTNFPVVNPTQASLGGGINECSAGGFAVNCSDAIVFKFNPLGSILLFSTYFGGNRNDLTRDMALASGNIYFGGFAASQNLPTVNALQPNYGGGDQDGFIVKILDTVSKKISGQITSQ